MKRRMNYRDFANEVYADDPEAKKLFLHQFENGWSCWYTPHGVNKITHKGREYSYVASDDKGHGYYQNGQGNHIMLDNENIVEIIGNER